MTLSNWIELGVLVVTAVIMILLRRKVRNMTDSFDGAVGVMKKKERKGTLNTDRKK